ncbi:MAG: ribosome small subunit-dependent GTPase A [Hyphomicrobiales bacterium]
MKRDYSKFLLPTKSGSSPKRIPTKLDSLGWQPFFSQQTNTDELAEKPAVRVTEVHKNGLHVVGQTEDLFIHPIADVTVGDWLLLDQNRTDLSRVLERKTVIKRRAPGKDRRVQLIASNIDTAFIVSSCNQDFNIARLERYVAVAFDAGVNPVIVLTKTDICEAPDGYVETAQSVSDLVPVVMLDARGDEPREKLLAWCDTGQTVAFLGSSGVGKSTLTNALAGHHAIRTRSIRDDDAKGRHTTTSRQLYLIDGGCAVLDTPGMRELQLTDASAGVADLFGDLQSLSEQCRFNDCQHETEPGCAVLAAVESGDVDTGRLARWRKLLAEERFNTSSLAERKIKDKALGKTIRQIMKLKKK